MTVIALIFLSVLVTTSEKKMTSGFHLAVLLCLASGLLTVEADCCEDKKPCFPVCPPGWIQFEHRCFYFHLRGKSWDQAERDCVAKGGNLASIHSVKEYGFVRDYMVRVSGGYRLTWLGGHDAVKEGFWMWSDGTNFDFTHWYTNTPNNAGKKEHCLEMNYGHRWNDRLCTFVHSYLCSQDLPCCDQHH